MEDIEAEIEKIDDTTNTGWLHLYSQADPMVLENGTTNLRTSETN